MTTLVADPPLRTAVVVGNPQPGSRTLAAAEHVARELSGSAADLVVDLASVAGGLPPPRSSISPAPILRAYVTGGYR
mgnify:CR=1 FL=1